MDQRRSGSGATGGEDAELRPSKGRAAQPLTAVAAVHDALPAKARRRLAFAIAAGVLVGAVALAILVNDEADDAVSGEAEASASHATAPPVATRASGPPRPFSGAARIAAGLMPGGAAPVAGGGASGPLALGAAPLPDGGASVEATPAGARPPAAHKLDGGVAVAGGRVVAPENASAGVSADSDGGVSPRDGGVPDAAPSRHAEALAAGEGAGRSTGGDSPRAGGASPPPRARADEEGSLTRIERFMAEGGSNLSGRIVAAETGTPIAGATIHAHSGGAYVEAYTDASGTFRVAGMPAESRAIVWVDRPGGAWIPERIELQIGAEGQATDVGTIRLLRGDELRERAPGWVGLFVGRRGAQLIAGAVSAWLPADKAEIQVGDELLSIDGHDTAGLGPRAATYLLRGTVGVPATVVVRSHGAKRTLALDRVPR